MDQKRALEILKSGDNVFLTGEAGTGKTYVLAKYIKFLKEKSIPLAVTATTGIAATHLDGITVDSWSGLGIRDDMNEAEISDLKKKFHVAKRVRKAKVIIIDEISMMHGARFYALDRITRGIRENNIPFGGLQVILSGDFFQLPPVTYGRRDPDFVFRSQSWRDLELKVCYLDKPKRQADQRFISLLRGIRQNQPDYEMLSYLLETKDSHPFWITPTKLYTHNVDVDRINEEELKKIPGQEKEFRMTFLGREEIIEKMKKTCLAPEVLKLKKGALVMFVRNNFEKGYVNGTLGKVVGFNRNNDPEVLTFSKRKITVEPASWTMNDEDKIIAQITQIPLRLAWAMTVHKSQGMTIDAAQIDLSKSFVEGMGYVALSRLKSLKGLKLLGINNMAIAVNQEVSLKDREFVELSRQAENQHNKKGFTGRWLKKYRFMYKLTTPT